MAPDFRECAEGAGRIWNSRDHASRVPQLRRAVGVYENYNAYIRMASYADDADSLDDGLRDQYHGVMYVTQGAMTHPSSCTRFYL